MNHLLLICFFLLFNTLNAQPGFYWGRQSASAENGKLDQVDAEEKKSVIYYQMTFRGNHQFIWHESSEKKWHEYKGKWHERGDTVYLTTSGPDTLPHNRFFKLNDSTIQVMNRSEKFEIKKQKEPHFEKAEINYTKLLGKWQLVEYSKYLPAADGSYDKFQKKKINKRKGIYYYEFRNDGTYSLSYRSTKVNCTIESEWWIIDPETILLDTVKNSDQHSTKSCLKKFRIQEENASFSLSDDGTLLYLHDYFYDSPFGGNSKYIKVDEITIE